MILWHSSGIKVRLIDEKIAEPALRLPLLHPILHSAESQTSELTPLDGTVVGALIFKLTSTYVCVSNMVIANIRKFLAFVIPYVLLLQCYHQLFASATPLSELKLLGEPEASPFGGPPGKGSVLPP